MALTPGTRLGVYEIITPIGEGGMGRVFRARDTKLDRDVAIKILPEAFAHDADRLARFQREAKTLASLNHPHIAGIYGLEESGGVTALVMELVEGEDLSQRIARGAIPVDEALPIVKQIAEALEAAHEQGIIHRDLKPANIKVRSDGTVKVLDFGLAKALETTGGGPDVSQSPTITRPAMTRVGVVLGTAAYMSPEQARGKDVDRRADIWAFGCVVYEMLTGTRAFGGDDVAETIGAVIHKEPDWSRLGPSVPSAVRLAVQRCLEKDRKRRLRDIGDVQLALSGAFDTPAVPVITRPSPTWKRAMPALTAAILVGLAAGVVAWKFRPAAPPPAVTRFVFTLPEGQFVTSRQPLALSPDGSQLAYIANDRIYIRSLGEFDAHAIAGIEGGATSLVFSPDGRALAFYSPSDQTLKRISVSGGAAVTICPIPRGVSGGPYGVSWDSSGILFGANERGILRCSSDRGSPEQILTADNGELMFGPQWLPGGEALLFTDGKVADGNARWDKAQIVVETIKGGARKTLTTGSDARYLPTGHLLYAQGGVIFAVPFDPARQVMTGEAVPVVEGVRRVNSVISAAALLSTSSTGTLIYIPGPTGTAGADVGLALADRAGVVTRLTVPPGPYEQVRASRDGSRIVVGSDDGKEAIVSIYDLAGTGAMRRLTIGGRNRFPIWSPDARIAFQSEREGDRAVFSQRADGNGPIERLTKPEPGEAHLPESWSPDGRFISFGVSKGGTYSLWILSVADKKATPFDSVQSIEPIGSVFSPDGRWIVYTSSPIGTGGRTPNRGIYIQPFPPTGSIYQVPHQQDQLDFHPVWRPKGTELFYVPSAASGRLAAVNVNVTTAGGITFGSPSSLPATVTGLRGSSLTRAYDILPDGRFVGLVSASGQESPAAAAPQIRVVLNWFEELKQRVPTK